MQNLLCLTDAGIRHGVRKKLVQGVDTYGSFSVYKADDLWQPRERIVLERAHWLPFCERFATSPFLAESCNFLALLAWLKEHNWLTHDVRVHILTDSEFLSNERYAQYKGGPSSTCMLCLHVQQVLNECKRLCPISVIWISGDLMKKTVIRH